MPVFRVIDNQQVPDIIYDPKYCAFWIDKDKIVSENILQGIEEHSLKPKDKHSESRLFLVISIENLIDLLHKDILAKAGSSSTQLISTLDKISSDAIEKLISRNSDVAHSKQKSPSVNPESLTNSVKDDMDQYFGAFFIGANQENIPDKEKVYEFRRMPIISPDLYVDSHLVSDQEEAEDSKKMHIVSMSEDHEKQLKEIQTKCNNVLSKMRTENLSQLDKPKGTSDSEYCPPDECKDDKQISL